MGGYSALHAEEKEDFKAILLISSFFDSEIPDALNEGRQSCLHIRFAPFVFGEPKFFFFPSENFSSGGRVRCAKSIKMTKICFQVLPTGVLTRRLVTFSKNKVRRVF